MKLIDIINKMEDGDELAVFDVDYDIEVYFYNDDSPNEFGKAMNKISSILNVSKIIKRGVITDLSLLIRKHLSELSKAELFKRNDIDSIMDCIESVFSGNVSEEWMNEFVDILCKAPQRSLSVSPTKFDVVLMEKQGDEGLSKTEAMDLYDRLKYTEGYPIEIENPSSESIVMGFITPNAAYELDYEYGELNKKIGEILADMNLENETGIYRIENLDIYLFR